jgi:hypothetical protein
MFARLTTRFLLSMAAGAFGPRAHAGTITAIAPPCAAVGAQVTIFGRRQGLAKGKRLAEPNRAMSSRSTASGFTLVADLWEVRLGFCL